MGFQLPSIQTIAWTGTGFLAPPFIEGFARPYLPKAITSNAFGRYAIKIAAVLGVGWAADAFAGREARNKVLLGGSVYILANLVTDFVPQLLPAPAPVAAGYYQRGNFGRAGAQPFLGKYSQTMGSYQTATAPTRLQPEQRF